MNHLIFKNASFSGAQTIVSALLLFFLYRFLLHKLGAEQLGVWAVVLASTSVARLSDMGLSGAALKFVAKNIVANKREVASHVVQTASISIGVVLILLLMIVYPLLKAILTLVIPAHALVQSISILPWAVSSLWFGLVAGIFQSALDGCNRMDIRNIILIVCNGLYLVGAYWLVPNYGLEGLAKGQFVQSVTLAVLSWLAIRSQLASTPWVPCIWRKNLFIEMFSYALNFQISSLAAMLFDPMIKFLLTKFGGLSEVAFYEMANQVILKARGILISSFQAVVPVIAGVDDSDQRKLLSLYRKSFSVLSFIAVPYFVSVGLALPLISMLWIGHVEIKFVTFGALLCLGWLFCNIGVPAYYHNIGTGHLVWNTITHILTIVLFLPLAIIFGGQHGGVAVVIAAMISLVISNIGLAVMVQGRLGISMYILFPSEHLWLFFWVALGAISCSAVYILTKYSIGSLNSSVLMLVIYLCISVIAVWVHPFRREIFRKLLRNE